MNRPNLRRRFVLISVVLLCAGTNVAGAYPPEGRRAPPAPPDYARWKRVSPCVVSSVPLPKVDVEPVTYTARGWTHHCPPVGDQLKTSSCLGWATAYYGKTILESVQRPSFAQWNPPRTPPTEFSPSFVYNQLAGGVDAGVDPSSWTDALQLIVDQGVSTLQGMPFTTDVTQLPSSGAFEEALHWKNQSWMVRDFPIADWDQPALTRSWLTALRAKLCSTPTVLILSVPNNFRAFPGPIDYVATSGDDWAYHAIACVGFNDDWGADDHPECGVGAVLCVNSWGTDWGAYGYVAIRYPVLMILALAFGAQLDLQPKGSLAPHGWRGPKGDEGAAGPLPAGVRRWPHTHPCVPCVDVTAVKAGDKFTVCSPPIPVHPAYSAEAVQVAVQPKGGGTLPAGAVVDLGFERDACRIGAVRHVHSFRATKAGSYEVTLTLKPNGPGATAGPARTVTVAVTE